MSSVVGGGVGGDAIDIPGMSYREYMLAVFVPLGTWRSKKAVSR